MEKIFSARLDEAVLSEMDRVTRQARMTKKQFLEEAILARAQQLTVPPGQDVWEETRGAWKRRGAAAASVREVRAAFQGSIERHHSRRTSASTR